TADPTLASLRGLIAQHGLHFEVLLETEHAMLATVSRLLVAAERHAVVGGRTVEIDAAGAQPRRDPPGMLDVARLDVAGKPVGRIVGDRNCLVLGVISQHRENRAENFLPRNGHMRRHVGEDGRTYEVSAIEAGGTAGAAADHGGALLDAALDQALHLVELRL